jgi:hypothetical protein
MGAFLCALVWGGRGLNMLMLDTLLCIHVQIVELCAALELIACAWL